MEPETPVVVPQAEAPRSTLKFVFLNDRGLRAGWRLAIFLAMLAAFGAFVNWALSHLFGRGRPPQGGDLQPVPQLIAELFSFLSIVLFTWVMSRIEKRKMGVYGLPLQRPAFSRFIVGYVFWGFLPLSLLLLVLRWLNVFYFG